MVEASRFRRLGGDVGTRLCHRLCLGEGRGKPVSDSTDAR